MVKFRRSSFRPLLSPYLSSMILGIVIITSGAMEACERLYKTIYEDGYNALEKTFPVMITD